MKRLVLTVGTLLWVSACTAVTGPSSASSTTSPVPPSLAPPAVLVGAGDIGWCGLAGAELTGALLDGIPGTVFTAGDNAYPRGLSEDFRRCYDPFWGRHLARTRPVPGNHDYGDGTTDGSAYFSYFGSRARPAGFSYYSYDVGAWHVVALDSEISAFPGSPQLVWLRDDLMIHASLCTLAIFHTPVFSSGSNGSNPHMQAAWQVLYEFGVDVVVNGHDHNYERFALQNPDGEFDPLNGIREFVVGTGGAQLLGFRQTRANSERQGSGTWGVLKLTLWGDRYDWEFVPVAGHSFSDSGSANCHQEAASSSQLASFSPVTE
jgi:hypothetical protein